MPSEVVVLVGRATVDLEDPVHDAAREVLQMPLNHLGLRLVRHGLDGDRPADVDSSRVCAVGTWFDSGERLPGWVWPWLERQQRKVRVLHFGSLQPLAAGDGGERLRLYLERLGLGYDTVTIGDPLRIDVEYRRADVVPFESKPVYERLHHGPWSRGAQNDVWLATRDRTRPRRSRAPVVVGPWGGIALQPWFVRVGGNSGDRRFYVDPFEFLLEALDRRDVPVPDPNVRFGRRTFVFHVDGDGFESVSTVGAARAVEPVAGLAAGNDRNTKLCAEVFRDRIIDRFRVPMTVSVIVASLTDRFEPEVPTERMALARDILSRPWVEAASHSVLHPLDWRRELHPRSVPRSVVWFPELAGYRHDMVAEVRQSIAFVDRWLLPPGKRCRVMLWSGAANPSAAALRAAREAGCENLNGDLFRWDELFDSVGYVSPWGHAIGDEFQVFAGGPNENIFDGFYSTMPGAFAHADRSLTNTGRDRILKPANVYAHFYSAEHPARLAALIRLLERWIEREPTFPVRASTYAAAVTDCERRVAIDRVGDGFRCRGFLSCRTVRFECEMPPVDWRRSRGIAGVRHWRGRTFVHLASSVAELYFVAGEPAEASGVASGSPRIEQSSCELTNVSVRSASVAFDAHEGIRRQVVLAGFPAAGVVSVKRDGQLAERITADAEGRVRLDVGSGGAVRLLCEVGSP